MHADPRWSIARLRLAAVTLAAVAILAEAPPSAAAYYADVEAGVAFSGYNDVQIPRDTGTLLSFTDDLDTDPTAFIRLRIGVLDSGRHKLSVLAAPLRFSVSGRLQQPISFDGKTFPAGTPLDGTYRFDSYRVTYLYALYQSSEFEIGIGITGKIRDAEVSLSGGDLDASYANTGFVPLFSFSVGWSAWKDLRFLIEGDALASPGGQGRAEDVFIGLDYHTDSRLGLRVGYRFLEGGADVEDVYNFTFIHYFALGARLSL